MSSPSRIALVGFMGSGKSTIGPLLAGRLAYDFVDLDREIESRAGARVSDIFATRGESTFREIEGRVLAELLGAEARVLATGGGAFAQPKAAETLLARAFVVHLDCDFDEACRRAALQGGRPLLENGPAAAAALYAERKDKYARAHVTIDTTLRSPEEVVAEIARLLPQP
ncbi:MAG: shikimate kinase [Vicinamibacteria bacterium]|nr:shikimate kinase [Vicinamibacteria bacterium]